MPSVLASVLHAFPPPPHAAAGFVNKDHLAQQARATRLPDGLTARFPLVLPGAFNFVYATGIGPGAAKLDDAATLADSKGMPLELKTATEAQTRPRCRPRRHRSSPPPPPVAALGVAVYLRKA